MQKVMRMKKVLMAAMLAIVMVSAVGCHHFHNRHFGGYYDRYHSRDR